MNLNGSSNNEVSNFKLTKILVRVVGVVVVRVVVVMRRLASKIRRRRHQQHVCDLLLSSPVLFSFFSSDSCLLCPLFRP